jgi:tetratricopeptide (TPR) repeat protein
VPDEYVDVFVSHCPADDARAEQLAFGLTAAGFTVFHQKWAIEAGDQVVGMLDTGMRRARFAVVLVSRPALAHLWALEKYAALATLAIDGRLERLVPVVWDDGVLLPPMLAARTPVSFVDAHDRPSFEARIQTLAGVLLGGRATGPVEVTLGVRPDDARLRDTPANTTLQIDAATTTLIREDGSRTAVQHVGVTAEVRHALWTAERARRAVDRAVRAIRAGQLTSPSSAQPDDLDAANRTVGSRLADAFLPEPLGSALAATLAMIRRSGRIAHLAVEIPQAHEDLANLPWESLVLPGTSDPVSLDTSVRMYRHVAGLGATAIRPIPGPLRILAVIASPDVGKHELLDYEYELASIIDQVQKAKEHAYVRILNWGSLGAIREALATESFHVLHISCHASEGVLTLETADGGIHQVTAEEFVSGLQFPRYIPPLVVLAGCRTGLSGVEEAESGHPLPAFARELIGCGVPSVIAMNTDVSDEYATDLLSLAYHELSARRRDGPEALHAISAARQDLERQRQQLPREDPASTLAEWPTVALHQRVRHNLLFDPASPVDPVRTPHRAKLPNSIVDLATGDFVGRRSELRTLLRELSGPGRSRGVLIHGIGGVGKSSLAAQLTHMLSEHGTTKNTLVIGVHGPHTVDQLLNKIIDGLRRWYPKSVGGELDLAEVAHQHYAWDERLSLLDELDGLEHVGVVLLFDDPLGDPIETEPESWSPTLAELEPDLTAFLGAWVTMSLATTLVITSRVRLALPARVRLVTHHLGPLSLAETRKLMFRLPALDALSLAEQRRAFEAVGGHPRALEYLDAVLTGGHRHRTTARRGTNNRFDAIVRRLDTPNRTGPAPAGDHDLEHALLTTVAIASSDILLDELVSGLRANFKAAHALLVAVSVHRQPIDDTGLRWSAAEDTADPDRQARLDEVYQALLAIERDGTARSRRDLDLPQHLHEQVNRDLSAIAVPPAPTWLSTEAKRLARLTLLTPAPPDQTSGNSGRYLVHRWTAMSLAAMIDPSDLRAAHQRAAAYHRWRAHLWHTVPDVYLRELEEVRFHSMQAGEPDRALAVAAEMCAALDLQGASAWEWELCEQTLAGLTANDIRGRVFRHRESVVALRRGNYDEAERLQREAQDLARTANDRVAMAAGLQQLGIIAQMRGDQATAEARYQEAVRAAGAPDVKDRPDARIVLAGCYQRLGGIALGRSDEDEAERFSIGAIEVAEEIADETGVTTVLHDLAGLARAIGDRAAADAHELRARDATAAFDDVHRLLAAALLQLAAVHLTRHLFDMALDRLEPALLLATEVGDRPLQAACEQLRGEGLVRVGLLAEARRTYEHFVELAEDLDDTGGIVVAHQQLGRIASMLGEPGIALAELTTAMQIARNARADALVAATHLVRGNVLVADGRSAPAATEFAAGLLLADELGQDGLAMGCVIQLALARLRADDPAGAAGLFSDGYDRAAALGSRRGMAVCLLAMAIVARQLGHNEDSAAWHRDALALAEEEHNPRLIAECLARSGDLALDRGDLAEAENLYQRCLDVLADVTAPELRGQVLRQLARCTADDNDYATTAQVLMMAVDDFADLAADEDQLACVVRLAWALARAGRLHSTRRAMRRAGDLARGRKPSPTVVIGLLLGAEQALADGDLDTAATSAEDARDAARVISDRWLIVDSSRVLAAVAGRQASLDDATQLLESSLIVSRGQQDRMMAMHLYRELGLVRAAMGDQQGARQHYANSVELAAGLDEQASQDAAELLRDGKSGDEIADEIAVADDDAADMVWLRRLRAVDGETAFAARATTYIGPSIDDIVRDLVPAFSGVAGVPAVVSPSTAVRVS